MNDFSFNDSMEESTGYNQDPGEKKKIIKFLICIVVAAIAGFSVYFITDALINGNKKPTTVVNSAKDTELELDDEMVEYLYDNVAYMVNGLRNDKFFKSGKVVADDFTTQEKFYYALRYATEGDFADMGVLTDSEDAAVDGSSESILKTYSISNDRIKEYMYNFFGEDVTYSTDSPVNIAVNFQKNGFNAGVLKYDAMSDSFLVTFDSVSKNGSAVAINPYLSKLVSAMRVGENSNIIIKEKVVFTEVKQYTDDAGELIDKYDCSIYKDYAKTNLIEKKTGVMESQLDAVMIENYIENASTVTYTFFKDDNDEYHFLSSEITTD